MTQDEITPSRTDVLRMAREAGAQIQSEWNMGGLADGFYMEYAEEVALRVAALVAAHIRTKTYEEAYRAGSIDEREACAKVCEEEAASWARLNAQDEEGYGAIQCAAAIRARGEK